MASVGIPPELPPELEKFVPKTAPVVFDKPLDASNLKGKSVLITGGASGIGLASAEAIAALGAYVTIADLHEEAGKKVAADLSANGLKVQFVRCDVTDYESQCTAFKSAIKFGSGKLDVVFPSAGIIAQRNLAEMAARTEASVDVSPPEPGFSGIDVNLKGVYYSSYLALHYFRLPAAPDAEPFIKSIVLISSLAGYIGYGASTTYSTSKFGVRGLFYGIRDQSMTQTPQVRVNLVAPWFVKTAMTDTTDPNFAATLQAFGFAPMENVVDAVLRFSSDQSVFGRSAMVLPEGNVDLGDNIWGGYGGPTTQEKMTMKLKELLFAMAALRKQKEELAGKD